MKKILFLLAVGYLLSFFSTPVYADCDSVRDGNNVCLNHAVDCLYVTGSGSCCDVTGECPSVPTPTPVSGGLRPIICKENEPGEGIQTAIGCIPTKDPTQFVAWILRIAIGLGGGIAFLLIVFGAFKVITSAGNPEGVKGGTEMITAAISGLIFIIFSLFLLQLIGVKILAIPDFGTP